MRPLASHLAVILFPTILIFAAGQSRAEMWCGNGPGTVLSHPCTDDDVDPAVSAAIDKYQDHWTNLDGVSKVDDSDKYHNRVPSIEVDVDPGSVDSVRKQIPASVDGIPVAIVPDKMTQDNTSGKMCQDDNTGPYGHYAYGPPPDPAEAARLAQQQADRAKAQQAYTSIVQQSGERWQNLPGVLGVTHKCDDGRSDFKTIEISVQRELLPEARDEIPSSVDGVRIVLTRDN